MNLEGKKIAILMGGPGSEREVSLASAAGVGKALRSIGAMTKDVDVTGPDFTVPEGTDICFNVIHGTFGEDGQLQRLLDARGLPYTGAGAETSELAFDKVLSKKRFIEQGVPTPAFEIAMLGSGERPAMPLPFVVKPPREGSSVGVHIVRDACSIDAALEDARRYDRLALVEECIDGKELTVGVLAGEALPIIHIQPRSGFYDMSNKYPWMNKGGGTDYFCPADLPADVTAGVQDAAVRAHNALGIEVYSRVDLLLDANHQFYVLEVNTIPGMTASSLLPKAAAAAGIEFPELCARIIEESLRLRG